MSLLNPKRSLKPGIPSRMKNAATEAVVRAFREGKLKFRHEQNVGPPMVYYNTLLGKGRKT